MLNAHKSLLAHASHELRTPLTRLRLGVEFFAHKADPKADPQADPQRAQALTRDIAELDELIEEILLASRLDTAAQAPMPEDVDLLALMAEACAQYDTATFDGEPVTPRGDARLLKRMVRNLLENAQRHGAPPIAVALRMNTGKVEIKVCDQGPGVPDAESERVFEPFYRRVGASEGGVGLGLALVRQIARRHGGDALAQGNCFTVQLPL